MNKNDSDRLLSVASGPHWHDGSSLAGMQILWFMVLLPAAIASVYTFGWNALRVMGLSIGASVLLDALSCRFLSSRDETANWNSAVLGLLLAILLPVNAPWWLVLIGAILTIIIGKRLFGGWGAHPVHPVALGYAMLAVSWPERLDRTASMLAVSWQSNVVEPTRLVKTLGAGAESAFDKMDLLMGHQAAGLGSGMVLWLFVGGVVLILLREIPWQVPLGFLAGAFFSAWLLQMVAPGLTGSPLFHLLAGNTMLAAMFLAPEHTNSPVNRWPMLIYGLLGGILLILIRAFSTHADGAIFVVLLINICAPLLDHLGPRVVGLREEGCDA